MKKVKMRIYGYVQGVGFRYVTKILADQLDVSGIVRNMEDGSVYIEANGSAASIDQFVENVKESPSPSAVIRDVECIEDDTIETRETFRVVF